MKTLALLALVFFAVVAISSAQSWKDRYGRCKSVCSLKCAGIRGCQKLRSRCASCVYGKQAVQTLSDPKPFGFDYHKAKDACASYCRVKTRTMTKCYSCNIRSFNNCYAGCKTNEKKGIPVPKLQPRPRNPATKALSDSKPMSVICFHQCKHISCTQNRPCPQIEKCMADCYAKGRTPMWKRKQNISKARAVIKTLSDTKRASAFDYYTKTDACAKYCHSRKRLHKCPSCHVHDFNRCYARCKTDEKNGIPAPAPAPAPKPGNRFRLSKKTAIVRTLSDNRKLPKKTGRIFDFKQGETITDVRVRSA